MKTIRLFVLAFIFVPDLFSQTYKSDLVCYINMTTGQLVKCDTSDHWDVVRNGDFIKLIRWINQFVGHGNNFVIQNRTEETKGTLDDGKSYVSQTFTGYSSDNVNTIPLEIIWQYVDTNKDGKWDQLRVHWIEPRAYLERVIFCHEFKKPN